jgi:hypothetical protein
MASISVAEGGKKRAPKTLDHLEIHPQLGGGHIIKHVYSGHDYPSQDKEVKFNDKGVGPGGEHVQAHLDKYAGLPAAPTKPSAKQAEPESETEDEV